MNNKKKVIGIFMVLSMLLLCGCIEFEGSQLIDTVTLLEGEYYIIPDTTINITLIEASSGAWRADCELTVKVEYQNETAFYILKNSVDYSRKEEIACGYSLKYEDSSDILGIFEVWR